MLAEPRWIHFYLWRHKGKPIYVGQAVDVMRRQKRRDKKEGLRKFLDKYHDECVLEILPDLVFDISHGPAANAVENSLMEHFGTMAPDGLNKTKAGSRGVLDIAKIGASLGAKKGGLASSKWAKENPEEKSEICRRAAYALNAEKTPEGKSVNALKGSQAAHAEKDELGRSVSAVYASSFAHARKDSDGKSITAKKAGATITFESRSKGARLRHILYPTLSFETGLKVCHNRWHVKRGIISPNCSLCQPQSTQ